LTLTLLIKISPLVFTATVMNGPIIATQRYA